LLGKGRPLSLKKIKLLAATDISYRSGRAYAVVAVFSFPELELVEVKRAECKITYPYVPGLLTFREAPCLIKAFSKIKSDPDIIIFDGQGQAHPRKMGVAAHMGIILDKPSIGCGKSRLVGSFREPGRKKSAFSQLYHNSEVIGAVLRSRGGVKPLFISPGYKIDLNSSIIIVLSCCRGFRIPEPIRFVDTESKRTAE